MSVRFTDVASPGVMISQTWPTSRETEGATYEAIVRAVADRFFERVQTVEVPSGDERRRIADELERRGVPLTYCIARLLNENGCNLSDLDEANRLRSVELVHEWIEHAREAGAKAVALISGTRPAEAQARSDALEALADSMARVCRAAAAGAGPAIVLEPLDVDAHKRFTLGYVGEAMRICDDVAGRGGDLRLCLDTSHMILNGDDPADSVARAGERVAEFHFCNCVVEAGHELFGDRHIPFGPPGVLTIERLAQLMLQLHENGFLDGDARPPVFCEVLSARGLSPEQNLRHCRETLERAWSVCARSDVARAP